MKIMGFEIWSFEAPYLESMKKDLIASNHNENSNNINHNDNDKNNNNNENFTYTAKYLNNETLGQEFPLNEFELDWISEPLSKNNIHLAKGAFGITINSCSIINKEVLSQLKEYGVRHVSTRSIGTNHIDLNFAKEIGIKITNVLYSPHAVSDFAIMLMLDSLRYSKKASRSISSGDYSLDPLLGKNIANQTIGLVGSGDIGAMVAKKLSSFGCKILVNNKSGNTDHLTNTPWGKNIEYATLDTLLEKSDIISLHCPLTDSTRNLINKSAFSKMKDGVILINTARGSVIDQAVLIENLKSGKVGFAALDVFENEDDIIGNIIDLHDEQFSEITWLAAQDNVIVTPHIAFLTREVQEETTVKSVLDLLKNATV